jgi:hypothetical protein
MALALLLPLSITGSDVLGTVADGALTSIEGRIVLEDGTTPLPGAVLRVAPLDSEVTYESAATDDEGRFRLADLPAGDYVLSVRDGSRVYQLGPGVRLAPGKHEDVLLGLAPGDAEKGEAEKGEEEEEDDDEELGLIKNSLTITLLAISGVTLLYWGFEELDGDDPLPVDTKASPSSP